MCKIAVMQPYLFPYIGYFQLIDSVDVFVCFDDVNFIKKGWINRNYILLNEQSHLWSLPLVGKSQNKLIKDHKILNPVQSQSQLIKLIASSYKKAPYYETVIPLMNDILNGEENSISLLACRSLEKICKFLGIMKTFMNSSNFPKSNFSLAQDRIIEIIKYTGGTQYHNAIGGQGLYDKDTFAQNSINLAFIDSTPIKYKQFKENFIPNLSIIDVLMFNNRQDALSLIKKYKLV